MEKLKIIIYILLLIQSAFLSGQSFTTKGQLWVSALTSTDVPNGQSSLESSIGYIPTLSLYRELDNNRLVDMELSYRLDRMYSGDSLINNTEDLHRYWVRYSNDKLEARLGLQKIVFGPSQILRSLSWFDTIDLKDPTGQTAGMNAFRLRWFPSNFFSLWSWAIMNNEDALTYGGRGEMSTSIGEWGMTFHMDPSRIIQKVALDYRYDGFIGFWNESVMINSDDLERGMITLGADYTLPIANGILIMTESMLISSKDNTSTSSQTFTAFMASLSIGMVHQAMCISQLDWLEERTYHYFRWSSIYDRFSLNFLLSVSPKRNEYNELAGLLPQTLAGFGTGVQLMFIYNH